MQAGCRRLQRRRFLLSRRADAGEGRAPSRPVRPRVRPAFQRARSGARGRPAPRELPEEWLRKLAEKLLTDEEKAQIEALGGWDKLMETLRQRLAEQKERHQGGSKWIGTAGTSPFGAYGYNPEGVRIGQDESRAPPRRQGLGQARVQGPRRRRSSSARATSSSRCAGCAGSRAQGAATELDLPGTIRSTAHNAGWLDLKMVPERHNAVKVLLLLDIGGSMDDHVRACEELFSAARGEFKHLEYFYFHNCLYERVWQRQPPPARQRASRPGSAAHLRPGLQADLRRRRRDEPLRDHPAGRQRRALERGGRQVWLHRLTRPYRRRRLAQPGAARVLGLRAIDRHDAATWRTGCFR